MNTGSAKIFELLSHMSRKEIRLFRDFLYSPFFNKSRKLTSLFDCIAKSYPNFHTFPYTKEQLHNNLFPETKFNDATMRHLFSDLMSLAEEFLVQMNLKKRPIDSFEFLFDEIFSKQYFSLLDSNLQKIDGFLDRKGQLGGNYFLTRFRVETDKFNFRTLDSGAFSKKNIGKTIEYLSARSKYLVSFFIIELTKSLDTLNLISQKYNISISNNFIKNFLMKFDLDKALVFLKSHPDLSSYSRLFSVYHKLYRAFAKFDYAAFYFDLKAELMDNPDDFSKDELTYLFKKLVDYCILKKKMRGNSSDFEGELFSLYETMLEKKYYLNKGGIYISPEFFRNVLLQALRMKKYEWTEEFIKRFSDELHPVNRNNAVSFGLASLNFEKKQFRKSLSYLNKLKLNNPSLKLDTKSLLLKLHYSLNETETALSLISAYREFLKKNHMISISRKDRHGNFILFVEKLISYKERPEKMNLIKLKEDILISNTVNKEWLIESVNKLSEPI